MRRTNDIKNIPCGRKRQTALSSVLEKHGGRQNCRHFSENQKKKRQTGLGLRSHQDSLKRTAAGQAAHDVKKEKEKENREDRKDKWHDKTSRRRNFAGGKRRENKRIIVWMGQKIKKNGGGGISMSL